MMHLRLLQQQCKHELHWCMHAFYMHICAARLLLTLERSNPARRPHKHLERSTFACTAHLCLLPPHNLSISLSLYIHIYLYINIHILIYVFAVPISKPLHVHLHFFSN